MLIVALALAAAGVAAGCGSDDGGELSREELSQRAEDARADVDSALADLRGSTSPDDIERALDDAAGQIRDRADELADDEVPAEVEDERDRLADALRALADEVDELSQAVGEGDLREAVGGVDRQVVAEAEQAFDELRAALDEG